MARLLAEAVLKLKRLMGPWRQLQGIGTKPNASEKREGGEQRASAEDLDQKLHGLMRLAPGPHHHHSSTPAGSSPS